MREPKFDPRFRPKQQDIDALMEADDEMTVQRTSAPPSQPKSKFKAQGVASTADE